VGLRAWMVWESNPSYFLRREVSCR